MTGSIFSRAVRPVLPGLAMIAMLVLLAAPAALARQLPLDLPPDATEPVPSRSEEPRTIGVFGDSLGDGLWIGLRRSFRHDERVADVLQLSEVSTGLANYVYRDIAEKTADQLADTRIDIAVVLFGSNDIQGLRDGSAVHAFRSPGWEQVYRARARDLIDQLHAHGATVYWVGLPVMRSTGYNANTIYLNSLFEEVATQAGARFVSTRAVSGDEAGAYAAYLPDAAGTPRLMRMDDGIHFTLAGYSRLAAPVAARIRDSWDEPQIVLPDAGADASGARAMTVADQLLNLTLNGQDYICTPANPLVSAQARGGANGARR